jgi:dipeptidyl aminopeptidase/acylaminoacyl peptidase
MIIAVRKYLQLLLGCMLLMACNERAEVREIPVNDFFKTLDRAVYRISPDGNFISYIKLEDKVQQLVVEDLKTGKTTSITNSDGKTISFHAWVSNENIIYYKDEGNRANTDVYITNRDGSGEKLISSKEKSRIKLLDEQLIDDKYLLITSNKRDSTVFDVYRLNVHNGAMSIVARNPGNFTNWLTDHTGKIRLAISSDGVNESLWYREGERDNFKKITSNNFKTTLNPIAFSVQKPNVVYAISNVNRDKNALVEIDCKTGKEIKVLFANDSLNVVEAQYSKQRGKIDFVVYENWKKERYYLDEESKKRYDNLDKLLPDAELRILSRDENEKHYVIRSFTDRNPGSYYLYNVDSNMLQKLSDVNPSINVEEMCEMKPISYVTKDGFRINGYLTLPLHRKALNLPVVVLPHNGPGQRNIWGYNADVQFLANRGYVVFQVNYRGSSGYGKEFYAAGFKGWGDKIQSDINEGVQWLIDQKIADPKRIAIYGNGFGGLIAINSAINQPDLYSCAGSNGGVLNLFSYLKTIPPFLTSSLKMFYEMIGDPVQDAEYMRSASPVFHADKVKIPVFITQNAKDPRINGNDAVQFVKELRKLNLPVKYLEREDTKTVTDREEARKKSYTALEVFLKDNLKNR